MTQRMTAAELRLNLPAVLDGVAVGEEVVITHHGRMLARLVPPAGVPTSVDDESLFSTGLATLVLLPGGLHLSNSGDESGGSRHPV